MPILIALLVVDAMLISGDLLRHAGVLHDVRFAVTAERGFGEWFQYLKAGTIALLLIRARRTIPVAWWWAGLFVYLLLDDAFAVHEAFGRFIAGVVTLPAVGAVRPSQLGELLLFAAVGLVFAGALAALVRRGDAASRTLTLKLGLPFAALVFFGVFVDVVHSFLADPSYRYAVGVIEDGGEMLAMSVLVAVAYSLRPIDRRSANRYARTRSRRRGRSAPGRR